MSRPPERDNSNKRFARKPGVRRAADNSKKRVAQPDAAAQPERRTDVTTDTALYPTERLARVADAVRASGLDVLLLTPGPDLRYVTGYDAKQLERLTCLVVPADGDPFLLVPRLELKAAQASPACALDLEIVTWGETELPFGMIKSRVGDPQSIGLSDRMWALHVLQFADAFPKASAAAGQHGAVAAADPQVGRRGGRAARGGRGDRPGARQGARLAEAGTDRAPGRREDRRGHPRRGARPGGLRDRRLRAERRVPAPRGLRPGDRGRRRGRGRHRRHDAVRVLLGLHADVRGRPRPG